MFVRIDRVFVSVVDAERSAAWYTRSFGFRRVDVELTDKREDAGYAELQVGKGETRLTLLEERPVRPNSYLHEEGHVPCFNFYTHANDLHEEELCNLGLHVSEAMDVTYMRVCEFADLDGNVIGICHERETSLYFTPSIELMEPIFHRVLAVFLPVADLAASIRWYVDMLGWTLVHNWDGGADLRVGSGETIVTMIQMEPEVFRRALHVGESRPYFSLAVEDVHDVHDALRKLGVETTPLERRTAAAPAVFALRTPEGLLIEVRGDGVKVHA